MTSFSVSLSFPLSLYRSFSHTRSCTSHTDVLENSFGSATKWNRALGWLEAQFGAHLSLPKPIISPKGDILFAFKHFHWKSAIMWCRFHMFSEDSKTPGLAFFSFCPLLWIVVCSLAHRIVRRFVFKFSL